MALAATRRTNVRLPPEVNRILYVRNLPYKITAEEIYDIFGKYGPIRQVRVGVNPETKGTAFVVYEDIFDAKNACDHLSGFNVCNRYLVVLYYQSTKLYQKVDAEKKQAQLDAAKRKYGVDDFEATCWENKQTQPHPGEIIEFPAVLFDCSTGKIEETFHHYVLPTECTTLTEFCKNFTGISQETVNKSDPISAVMKLFSDWLKSVCAARSIVLNPTTEQPGKYHATFVTWSDWDLGTQLLYECRRKSVFRASHFNAWIDLRLSYRKYYKSKPQGLNGALEERGMLFVGREHSGIDDTKNTARLVFKMICDGHCFRVTKAIQGKQVISMKPAAISKPSTVVSKPPCPVKTTITPPLCKCGAASARKQTLNGGPHHGRYYFTCKSKSCHFYTWESAVIGRNSNVNGG